MNKFFQAVKRLGWKIFAKDLLLELERLDAALPPPPMQHRKTPLPTPKEQAAIDKKFKPFLETSMPSGLEQRVILKTVNGHAVIGESGRMRVIGPYQFTLEMAAELQKLQDFLATGLTPAPANVVEAMERSYPIVRFNRFEAFAGLSSIELAPNTRWEDVVDSLHEDCLTLRRRVRVLQGVIAQHNLCHDLHGLVDAAAFNEGCVAEQRKLYGRAPDRDTLTQVNELVRGLGFEQSQLDEDLAGCLLQAIEFQQQKRRDCGATISAMLHAAGVNMDDLDKAKATCDSLGKTPTEVIAAKFKELDSWHEHRLEALAQLMMNKCGIDYGDTQDWIDEVTPEDKPCPSS